MSSIFEWIGKNAYWIFDGIGVIVITGILGVMFKKRLYVDGYDKYFEALTKYNVSYLLINNENLPLEETS